MQATQVLPQRNSASFRSYSSICLISAARHFLYNIWLPSVGAEILIRIDATGMCTAM